MLFPYLGLGNKGKRSLNKRFLLPAIDPENDLMVDEAQTMNYKVHGQNVLSNYNKYNIYYYLSIIWLNFPINLKNCKL